MGEGRLPSGVRCQPLSAWRCCNASATARLLPASAHAENSGIEVSPIVGHQSVATSILIAGTLVVCDAWFDVVTSFGSREEWVTLLAALDGEFLVAAIFWIARLGMRRTVLSFHEISGRSGSRVGVDLFGGKRCRSSKI